MAPEASKRTFTATVSREGKWWMISVADVGLTQARRLSKANDMATELVAVTLDIAIDEVNVDIIFDGVGEVQGISSTLETIRSERAEASALEQSASRGAAELAKRLAAEDVPIRDVGTILGVSHQRAHQLVSS